MWNTLLRATAAATLTITGAIAMSEPLPPFGELPKNEALPDPFTMLDGTKISTPDEWNEKRRPELKQLFQHYMYGYLPDALPIAAKDEAPPVDVLAGAAELRQIEISFVGLPDEAPRIHLALFLPKDAPHTVPVFLCPNKCGNHTILPDPAILINDNYPGAKEQCDKDGNYDRGSAESYWAVDYVISRGYAFATFRVSDLDPDRNDFTDGIHPYFPQADIPASSRMGTIGAWAWGLHRAVDYLLTVPEIDPKRICLNGHSRRGKTVLFAAAMDERIALVNPHQSGTGGMALSRNNGQETVKRINTVFPHWFTGAFKSFNDNEAQLPFDQHLLAALVAPRPLLDTAGLKDTWANYESALRTLKAATPVYEFLGVKGVQGGGIFQNDEAPVGGKFGKLMQYRLDTKHELNKDYWRGILDFADAHLKH